MWFVREEVSAVNDRKLNEKAYCLAESEPCETERKFLIEYPDVCQLDEISECRKIDIVQTYLNSVDGEEVRVRRWGENGSYIYFKTVKKKVNDIKRVEIESPLTEQEYLSLLKDADITKRQICKTRYCLMYENQCFEIDIYPFWSDRAIVEIELNDEKDEIRFPDLIRIIKEVTADEAYKNSSLANIKSDI